MNCSELQCTDQRDLNKGVSRGNTDQIDLNLKSPQTVDTWTTWVKKIWNCAHCGEAAQKLFMPDCTECGKGIGEEEKYMTLEGYDAVQLFPSLESSQIGRVIREEVKRSNLNVKAFSWKQAAKYIAMNREYTGELDEIEGSCQLHPQAEQGV